MILPLAPTARDDPLLPFAANGGDNKNRRGDDLSGPLRLVSDEACAAFLHDKKLTQVNGTHTALAFVALAEAPLATYAGELAIDAPRDLASMPLRSLAGMSERHARALWLWCVAEALELLLDHGADVAKRALGDLETDAELIDVMLADAKMALERHLRVRARRHRREGPQRGRPRQAGGAPEGRLGEARPRGARERESGDGGDAQTVRAGGGRGRRGDFARGVRGTLRAVRRRRQVRRGRGVGERRRAQVKEKKNTRTPFSGSEKRG
jgi:hypothetical protein